MAKEQFIVTDKNPNDAYGGCGCLCDPRKVGDCKGPYVVFYSDDSEMLDSLSPVPVIGVQCVRRMAEMLDKQEPAQLDIPEHIEPRDQRPRPKPAVPEPPVVEWPNPDSDFSDLDL